MDTTVVHAKAGNPVWCLVACTDLTKCLAMFNFQMMANYGLRDSFLLGSYVLAVSQGLYISI